MVTWNTWNIPSGELTVCKWKWPFIVDFPIKNRGSFHCYVSSPEGIQSLFKHGWRRCIVRYCKMQVGASHIVSPCQQPVAHHVMVPFFERAHILIIGPFPHFQTQELIIQSWTFKDINITKKKWHKHLIISGFQFFMLKEETKIYQNNRILD